MRINSTALTEQTVYLSLAFICSEQSPVVDQCCVGNHAVVGAANISVLDREINKWGIVYILRLILVPGSGRIIVLADTVTVSINWIINLLR